ncbi:MAG: hypothetical protein JJU40_04580 [Rhodobacteraceae bacterium]|nr:hypothetical protein [Paracoccaceae bacterium]
MRHELAIPADTIPTLRSSIADVAAVLGQEVDFQIVQPDADTAEGRALASLLRAMGVEVFSGWNDPRLGPDPLILVHVRNRKTPEVRMRTDTMRRLFPDAPVCVALSAEPGCRLPEPAPEPVLLDARALLEAIGIPVVFTVDKDVTELSLEAGRECAPSVGMARIGGAA